MLKWEPAGQESAFIPGLLEVNEVAGAILRKIKTREKNKKKSPRSVLIFV
jgi:hypothetical protein